MFRAELLLIIRSYYSV